MREAYKGFVINPAPLPLAEGGWNLQVYIEKHRDSDVTMRQFSAGNIYETEQEAIKNCLIFGKQIIDGKAGILSVSDL